jgi:hypothetical protein
MEAFQQRVVDEKRELDEKIARLEAFRKGDLYKDLPWQDCALLTRQQVYMQDYSNVLGARIAQFPQGG